MDIEERLIELVRENSFIYDKRNANYKKNEKKEKKWQEIAVELDIPTESVKKRWRTIKDRYNRVKKQENVPSGSGAKPIKVENYKFAEQLSFLDNFSAINTSTHTNYDEPSTSSQNFVEEWLQDEFDYGGDFQEERHPLGESPTSSDIEFGESSRSPSKEKNVSRSNSRRRLVDEVLIANTNKELIGLMQSLKEDGKSKTKELAFCESLAVQLEEVKLPPERFMSFQMKVLQILDGEIKMCNLNKAIVGPNQPNELN